MNKPGVETLAIVRATLEEVCAHHAALMLRMWHHAREEEEREILLADFASAGEPRTFVQAFLAAARLVLAGDWPRLSAPSGFSPDHLPMLERAFVLALGDVLAPVPKPLVLNSWADMVRAFLREFGRHG